MIKDKEGIKMKVSKLLIAGITHDNLTQLIFD